MQTQLFEAIKTNSSGRTCSATSAGESSRYTVSSDVQHTVGLCKDVTIATAVASKFPDYSSTFASLRDKSCDDIRQFAIDLLRFLPSTDVKLGAVDEAAVDVVSRVYDPTLIEALELTHARGQTVMTPRMFYYCMKGVAASETVKGSVSEFVVDNVSATYCVATNAVSAGEDFLRAVQEKHNLVLKPVNWSSNVGNAVMYAADVSVSERGFSMIRLGDMRLEHVRLVKKQERDIIEALNSLTRSYIPYFRLCPAEVIEVALRLFAPGLHRLIANKILDVVKSCDLAADMLPKAARMASNPDVWVEALNHMDVYDHVAADSRLGMLSLPKHDRNYVAASYGAEETTSQVPVGLAPVAHRSPKMSETYWNDRVKMHSESSHIKEDLKSAGDIITLYANRASIMTRGLDYAPVVDQMKTRHYNMIFSTDPLDPYVIVRLLGDKTEATTESCPLLMAYLIRQVLWSTEVLRSIKAFMRQGVFSFKYNGYGMLGVMTKPRSYTMTRTGSAEDMRGSCAYDRLRCWRCSDKVYAVGASQFEFMLH
jgi:hypothetical protein